MVCLFLVMNRLVASIGKLKYAAYRLGQWSSFSAYRHGDFYSLTVKGTAVHEKRAPRTIQSQLNETAVQRWSAPKPHEVWKTKA
jgi:hypothetical protein